MNSTDAYREGYEKGRAHGNIIDNAAEAVFGQLRDDPGGYYAAGYRDGAAGKKFQPPAPQQVKSTTAPIPKVSVSDAEKAWLRLCEISEFISLQTASEHWERLKGRTESVSVYMVGLYPFFRSTCPRCGEIAHYKGHFLGRVGHPTCGSTWYVPPMPYIGKQLAATFHTGLRAGGSIKDDADRKGDRVGGWFQAFLAFYFVAAFRLLFAVVLIPIQAVLSLSQPKPQGGSTDRTVRKS